MPALNAVLSVNPTQLVAGQAGTVQLVLQNTTANTATITSIQAFLNSANAPVNMGLPPYGQGLLSNIAANSSVTVTWGIAPSSLDNRYTGGSPASSANPANYNVNTNPATVTSPSYTVNALIQTSDGVVTTAVPQSIQITPFSLATPLPLNGQLRFDTSVNSGLLGVL